ncbi:MAG: hypothetical protein LBV55_03710 [Acholeplasmatales bacterium]|jgi:ABC-2 type transport system permease protein|nr:hypothetical protein [Acholeplasmatales bacterium]
MTKEVKPRFSFIKNKTLYKLLTLISLFLIEYRSTSNKAKTRKSFIVSLILNLVSFIVITLVFFAVFYLGKFFSLFNELRINVEIMYVIMAILVVILFLTTIIRLVKNLYFSTDSKILLPLPVAGNVIFTAKLISTLILEMLKSLRLMIPAFIAYGIMCKFLFPYYLLVIFGSFLIIMAISVLSALLSIPALFIAKFFRSHPFLLIGVFALIMGLIVYILFALIFAIPDDMNILNNFFVYYMGFQNLLKNISKFTILTNLLTHLLVGQMRGIHHALFTLNSFYTILVLFGSIGVLGVSSWFSSRSLYLHLCTKELEYKKESHKPKNQLLTNGPYLSTIKKELKERIRSPKRLFGETIYVFILPFMVLLLNKTLGNIDMSVLGYQLSVVASVLIILVLLLSSNTHAATVISSEGKAFPLLQTTPQDLRMIILAKLSFNAFLSFLSLLATIILLSTFKTFTSGQLSILFFSFFFILIAHLLLSLDLDLLKPKFDLYHQGEAIGNDPKILYSFLHVLLISGIFSFAIFIFLKEDYAAKSDYAYLKILGLSALLLVSRVALSLVRLKSYFYLSGDEQ